jgi:hypothetical protein
MEEDTEWDLDRFQREQNLIDFRESANKQMDLMEDISKNDMAE